MKQIDPSTTLRVHSNASESNVIVYIIDCGVSVAIVLSNIIDVERGDNSHSDAIRIR